MRYFWVFLLGVLLADPCLAGSSKYNVQLADGTVTVDAKNNGEIFHELTVVYPLGVTITAGTMSVEARPRDSVSFFPIKNLTNIDLTQPVYEAFSGNVVEYRFTFSGVVGSSSAIITDVYSYWTPGITWYGDSSLHDAVETGPDGDVGLAVFIRDQATPTILIPFNDVTNSTTLAAQATINTKSITLTSVTGFDSGDYVCLDDVADGRYYCGKQVGAPVGNVITLDTPLDFTYPAGVVVTVGGTNLNVDGSVTPRIFSLRAGDPGVPVIGDITRLIFQCITNTAADLSLFGDIPALTNGLVLRKKNLDGTYSNVFNVKSNADLAGIMFDFDIYAATNPAQGVDGFVGRLTFAGSSKFGVVLRIAPFEDLELVIQDDLTDLTQFIINMEGHIAQIDYGL